MPNFRQSCNVGIEDEPLDVPEGVGQVGDTGVLGAEELVLCSVGIEVTGSFYHVGSESVEESGWADLGHVAETAQLAQVGALHGFLEDVEVLLFELVISLVSVQLFVAISCSPAIDKSRA